MKVLFFTENPNLFIEYESRLEENKIPFWKVSNINDLHHMISQMDIKVVFIDYNVINFSTFDVYKHIKDKGGDVIPLFINNPSDKKNLFVQWEDSVLKNCPQNWTKELEALLRIMENKPVKESIFFRFPRVQDKEPLTNTKLVEDFYKIKQLQKLSFSEFLILDLLKRRKKDFVTIQDMIQVLDMSHEEKNIKKIYRYIHNIRRYLEQQNHEQCSLIRIKKSVYSLVSHDRD